MPNEHAYSASKDRLSEEVVFPDFARRAQLPEGELVPVEIIPGRGGRVRVPLRLGDAARQLLVR